MKHNFRIKPITADLGPSSFNASSWYDINTAPQFAQLYSKQNTYWKPKQSSENEYLQIDLGHSDNIYGLEISGNPVGDEFVTSYKVMFSLDGISHSYVLYRGQPEVILKFHCLKLYDTYLLHFS